MRKRKSFKNLVKNSFINCDIRTVYANVSASSVRLSVPIITLERVNREFFGFSII